MNWPGFNPRQLQELFLVKMTLQKQVFFFQQLQFSLGIIIQPIIHCYISFIYHWRYINLAVKNSVQYNISLLYFFFFFFSSFYLLLLLLFVPCRWLYILESRNTSYIRCLVSAVWDLSLCVSLTDTEWPTPKVPHDTACGFHTVWPCIMHYRTSRYLVLP